MMQLMNVLTDKPGWEVKVSLCDDLSELWIPGPKQSVRVCDVSEVFRSLMNQSLQSGSMKQ
jgi:hypothetical protein